MIDEKKIWMCEQYAHKAWTLSLGLAQEAARANHFGRGYAVIAEETRNLANKLFDYVKDARFNGNDSTFKGIVEFALMTGFLAVNTILEILRVETETNCKSIAIYADDIRNLALALNELADKQVWQRPFIIPEITSPLKSTAKSDFFFQFSIGGIPLVENTFNIDEVMYCRKADLEGESFNLRGMKLPVINCYKKLNIPYTSLDPERQTVMIINPDNENNCRCMDLLSEGEFRKEMCAVPVDDLDVNTIFRSRIGYNVPPKSDSAFAEYVRECWDVIGNKQLMFVDWQRFIF